MESNIALENIKRIIMNKASQRINKSARAIWLPSLMLEVVSIIIAVLLALGVNEWRESRSHKKLADQALATIHDEIVENKKLFETILPHHKELLDTLIFVDNQIKNGLLSEDDDRAELQFVPLFVQHTAWQTALATQALWVIVLHLLGRSLWKYSTRRLSIQGG